MTMTSNVDKRASSKVDDTPSDAFEMKLSDLKVADLRTELENRELNKNGVKSELVERLRKALISDGENPDEYVFKASDNSTNKSKSEPMDTSDVVSDHDANEESLQISVDDEEAQFNEEENCLENHKSETEVSDYNPKGDEASSKCDESDLSESASSKVVKPADDSKDKKVSKASVPTKGSATSEAAVKSTKVIAKSDKAKNTSVISKSLWITGLANTTRAADLKTLFSKQGRVLSVKIVKSTKQSPGKCYGCVTMATSKDATKAIQNLHRTELNGRTISVERTQSDPSTLLKKMEAKLLTFSKKQVLRKEMPFSKPATEIAKPQVTTPPETKKEEKVEEKPPAKPAESSKSEESKSTKRKEEKVEEAEKGKTKEKEKEKDRKPRERDNREKRDNRRPTFRRPAPVRPRPFAFHDRMRFGNFRRPFGRRPFASRPPFRSSSTVLLQKIREERMRERESFRERERREEERRRLAEIYRHKLIERRQREEAYRLEREKEKLRLERELLERERAEMLKLEREKQRLERERLNREREALRRQVELRRTAKRPAPRVEREPEPFWDERKRSSPRYDVRSSFGREEPASGATRYADFPPRERASYGSRHDLEPRFATPKPAVEVPEFHHDRDSRREVNLRGERDVYERNEFRDRDSRRNLPVRENRSTSRREPPRDEWKHERRVRERVVPSSSSSGGGQRRMAYY